MGDQTSGFLGILPPLLIGGAGLMMVDRFIRQPYQKREGRKRGYFDRQEYKDIHRRGRGLDFGDFSNIGW